MGYKDEFVLLPEEKLNEMNKAYKQAKKRTTQILTLKNEKKKVLIMRASNKVMSKFIDNYFALKKLRQSCINSKARALLVELIDQTESELKEVRLLYGNVNTESFKKQMGFSLNFRSALSKAIEIEIDTVKTLLNLSQAEHDDDRKQIVGDIASNRLEVLKKLNTLSVPKIGRRF